MVLAQRRIALVSVLVLMLQISPARATLVIRQALAAHGGAESSPSPACREVRRFKLHTKQSRCLFYSERGCLPAGLSE